MPYKDPEVRRAKARERTRRWYRANKEKAAENARKRKAYYLAYRQDPVNHTRKLEQDRQRREQRSRLLAGMKIVDGCTHCGCRDGQLVWHHRDPTTKKFNISRHMCMKWNRLMDEVDKCDVLCEECHLDLHRS
jgi:hypothetical protein